MKKYLSNGLGLLVLSSLLFGATPVFAAEYPTTDPSPTVTTTTATLGGTNDDASDVGTQAFWYGTTSEGPFVSGPAPTLPSGWTGGVYADTFNPASDVAGGDFSKTITSLSSSTTYYYVAWVSVGGIWYPGDEESFTTDTVFIPQTITVNTSAPSSAVYGSTFNVAATSDSSLIVDITVTGGCSIAAGVVTMESGVTDCEVHYNQAGDMTYSPAIEIIETVNAEKFELTVSGVTASSKTYDGDDSATVDASLAALVETLIGSDVVTLDTSGADGTFTNKHAENGKTVNVTGLVLTGSGDEVNYTLTQPTTTANIDRLAVTVTASLNSKVYDGNTTSVATPTLSAPLVGSDTAVLTQVYLDENVGIANKTVVPSAVITDGNSGNNYTVTPVNNTASTISTRVLNVVPSASDKVYNANTVATISFTNDKVSGDNVTVSGTGSFATKTVDTGKVVSLLTTVKSGADAGNYNLVVTPTVMLADITPAELTPVVTASDKVYDGDETASAACTVPALGTDVVTCSVDAATWGTKDVGNGKTVTATGITIDGADAGNYVLSTTTETDEADITPKELTVSFTADNKVYDGNDSATILTRTATGTVGVETVVVSDGIATFDNKNFGTNKTVTAIEFTLSDSNYSVGTINTTTANITRATLVPEVSASSKDYDANTNASAACSVTPIGDDDVACVVGSASFEDKDAGVEKRVDVSGMTLSGEDADNYVLSTTSDTTAANIYQRELTVSAVASNKVVDGTTTATVTLTNNALLGDVVTQTYVSADFDDASVGTGKTVTVNGIAIFGAGVDNYELTSETATSTADITERRSSGSGGSRPRTSTGTTGTVLGSAKFNFTQNIKLGSVGNEVMELQKFLNANGFGTLTVDGNFGPMTKAAVIKFQLANGLVGDGVVGPLTRAVLNK